MKARGGFVLIVCAVALVLSVPAITSADPIPLTIQVELLGDLGATTAATALNVSSYNYNNVFKGTVSSQAFQLTSGDYAGDYLYLYQVDNNGPSVLENMAIAPFNDISENGSGDEMAGYLSGGEPTGFAAGGYAPMWMTYDAGIPMPLIACNYPSGGGAHVPAGEHTVTIFVISENEPTLGEIYVIDSGVATVNAVVPIPEPFALALLISGSVLTGLRRRRIINS